MTESSEIEDIIAYRNDSLIYEYHVDYKDGLVQRTQLIKDGEIYGNSYLYTGFDKYGNWTRRIKTGNLSEDDKIKIDDDTLIFEERDIYYR